MGNRKNTRTVLPEKTTSQDNLGISRTHHSVDIGRRERRAEELKQIREKMEREYHEIGIPHKRTETDFWLEEIAYWLEGLYWNR